MDLDSRSIRPVLAVERRLAVAKIQVHQHLLYVDELLTEYSAWADMLSLSFPIFGLLWARTGERSWLVLEPLYWLMVPWFSLLIPLTCLLSSPGRLKPCIWPRDWTGSYTLSPEARNTVSTRSHSTCYSIYDNKWLVYGTQDQVFNPFNCPIQCCAVYSYGTDRILGGCHQNL